MTFNSFNDLENFIKKYEKSLFCNLYKFQAITISNLKGRVTKTINPLLRYYEITYRCVFGDKTSSKNNGKRNKLSLKINCPVKISLRASNDGLCLEVRGCILSHNHERNEVLYRNLPNQRKIDPNDPAIIQLIELGANKKLIQSKIYSDTGKNIRLKSIHNMRTNIESSLNTLVKIEHSLKDKFNCYVRILHDEKNQVSGIFFADTEMKRFLKFYPEVMFIDATYKLLNSRYL